jgi:hypothetical protein
VAALAESGGLMLPVSSRFLPSLAGPHRVYVRADIFPLEGDPYTVAVVSGDITADRDARVRRQGSLAIPFVLATDADRARALCFGGECQIRRGILYPDGAIEAPIVGTFRIDTLSWSRAQGEAQLTLSDRMAQVQDEPFVVPWQPNGLRPSEAIVAAVQDVFGSRIAYHVSTSVADEQPLKDATYDEDRAQAISDLASSISAATYFDAAGDFVLAPAPASDRLAVWAIDASPTGVLVDAAENLDRSAIRNGVAVRAQPDAEAPPIYALAVDDDPSSPTRWGGPFGKVAMIATSDSVQTQAQADATARNLLRLRLGAARVLTLQTVPNPALEPDDMVTVSLGAGRQTERQEVNAVHLSLGVNDAMAVTCTSHYVPGIMTGARAVRELRSARLVPA